MGPVSYCGEVVFLWRTVSIKFRIKECPTSYVKCRENLFYSARACITLTQKILCVL